MDFLSATILLFFIMDPIGNIPIFHTVLHQVPYSKRNRVIFRELVFAYIILVVFLFAGESILSFLGLKQATLSITGGIVLFLIGLDIVFPSDRIKPDSSDGDPFIVPLAVPMVAGPTTIAALLLLASQDPSAMNKWFFALTSAWVASAVILLGSGFIMKLIGQKGVRAIEKLIGMLLIMLSVQMFLDGVKDYLQLGS